MKLSQLLLLTTISAIGASTFAQPIVYQGRISNSSFSTNSEVDMKFQLFDADASGSQITSPLEFENIPVNNDLFSVILDFGSLDYSQNLWLEITPREPSVSGAFTTEPPLFQRVEIGQVPIAQYAFEAGSADQLAGEEVNTSGDVSTALAELQNTDGLLFEERRMTLPGDTTTGLFQKDDALFLDGKRITPLPLDDGFEPVSRLVSIEENDVLINRGFGIPNVEFSLGVGRDADETIDDGLTEENDPAFIRFDDFAIQDPQIGVLFDDAIPENVKWRWQFNDFEEGGDNYFAIQNASANRIPFKLHSSTEDGIIIREANQEISIGTRLHPAQYNIATGFTPPDAVAFDQPTSDTTVAFGGFGNLTQEFTPLNDIVVSKLQFYGSANISSIVSISIRNSSNIAFAFGGNLTLDNVDREIFEVDFTTPSSNGVSLTGGETYNIFFSNGSPSDRLHVFDVSSTDSIPGSLTITPGFIPGPNDFTQQILPGDLLFTIIEQQNPEISITGNVAGEFGILTDDPQATIDVAGDAIVSESFLLPFGDTPMVETIGQMRYNPSSQRVEISNVGGWREIALRP